MGKLDGKVALVTGAAQGVGAEYARRFHREGAAVVLVDIKGDDVARVAKEIEADGGRALALTVDVADEDATIGCARDAVEAFGRVDVLVNDAAICGDLDSGDKSFAYFKRVMEVNLYGPLLMARAVFPTMKEQGGGAIVNQASTAAYLYNAASIAEMAGTLSDEAPLPHYPLSKAGVIALTKFLAGSMGRFGIRVNCLTPGGVRTEGSQRQVTKEMVKHFLNSTALRSWCEVSDLADACVFLASDDSRKITGQNLVIDCGQYMIG